MRERFETIVYETENRNAPRTDYRTAYSSDGIKLRMNNSTTYEIGNVSIYLLLCSEL